MKLEMTPAKKKWFENKITVLQLILFHTSAVIIGTVFMSILALY